MQLLPRVSLACTLAGTAAAMRIGNGRNAVLAQPAASAAGRHAKHCRRPTCDGSTAWNQEKARRAIDSMSRTPGGRRQGSPEGEKHGARSFRGWNCEVQTRLCECLLLRCLSRRTGDRDEPLRAGLGCGVSCAHSTRSSSMRACRPSKSLRVAAGGMDATHGVRAIVRPHGSRVLRKL